MQIMFKRRRWSRWLFFKKKIIFFRMSRRSFIENQLRLVERKSCFRKDT